MTAAEEEKNNEAPLVLQALEQPLLEALEETAPKTETLNEQLSWGPFVRLVVYYFIAGLKSGRLLLTHLQHADPALGLPTNLKRSTFFEAFRRFPAAFARRLFSALLRRLSFFPVAEMAELGILCAVDGSHWPAIRSMSWAVVGANKPTVLMHLAFGLNQMIPVGLLLTESNSSERNALRQMLQAGVTYVSDRGYFAYALLLDIAKLDAFFVIRAPYNVTYTVLETLTVTLPQGVNWLFNVQDLKVHCDKGQSSGTWRVVRFFIGQSEFVLFSNRWDLSTWQVILIYAYRWQIELIFLFLKRTLNGLHLLTHSKNGLEIQFNLMLSAALLLLHFKQSNDRATKEKTPEAEPVQVPLPQEDEEKTPKNPEEKSEPETTSEKDTANTEQGNNKPEAAQESKSEDKSKEKQKAGKEKGASTTRSGTIEDVRNARWYRTLGKNLRDFWRISRHWLQTLRDNLARPWNPDVFSKLPGLYVPRN